MQPPGVSLRHQANGLAMWVILYTSFDYLGKVFVIKKFITLLPRMSMKPLVACCLHLGYPESGTAQLSSLEAKKRIVLFCYYLAAID